MLTNMQRQEWRFGGVGHLLAVSIVVLCRQQGSLAEYVCLLPVKSGTSLQDTMGMSCNVTNVTNPLGGSLGSVCVCNTSISSTKWYVLSNDMNKSMNATPGEFYLLDQTGRCVLVPVGTAKGKATPFPCPPGFYCDGGREPPKACRAGDHCMWNTDSSNKTCPAGFYCPTPASPKQNCPDGADCQAGSKEPGICIQGTYCKGGVTKQCPKDTYCPFGSSEARPCGFLTMCPAGSGWQDLKLQCLLLISVAAILGYFLLNFYARFVESGRKLIPILIIMSLIASMWFFSAPITIFGSVLYIVVIANWLMLKMVSGHVFIARICLAVTFIAMEFLLYLTHPQWAIFIAGLLFMAIIGFLISREVRGLRYLGRIALTLFFGGLIAFGFSVDSSGTFFIVSAMSSAIFVLLAVWVLQQIRQRSERRRWLPPFFTRWRGDTPVDESPVEGQSPQTAGFDSRWHGNSQANVLLANEAQRGSSLQRVASAPSSAVGSEELAINPNEAIKGISFHLVDLSFELLDGTKLLADINLHVGKGRRVAVMGPSGSGKSTLLAVLSGRASYGEVRGQLSMNGRPVENSGGLRAVTGFVPQDDILHGELSVTENIRFQAALRFPSKSMEANILEVLKNLGLSELSEKRVGSVERRGLSGGQRKRVSIAMELVTKPHLLFADEPTSGLDSTTSHDVVKSLNESALQDGTTVVAVIHQPRYDTLCLFDDLILMGVGGCLVYADSTAGAKDFFEQHFLQASLPDNSNPADVFLDVTQKTAPEICKQTWQRNGKAIPPDDRPEHIHYDRPRPALIEALLIFSDRSMRQILNSYPSLLANWFLIFASTTVVCVVIANTDLQNFTIQSAFAALALMLVQGVAAQRTFGADLLVTSREAQVGVPMIPYFLGKDLASLVEITAAAAVFTATYGALSRMDLQLVTLYQGSWAFIYSFTGLNYIFSIIASPTSAQMGAVVGTFAAFCVAGIYNPTLPTIVLIWDNRGWMIPALSPIRWFWAYILTAEAQYFTDIVRMGAQGMLYSKGYDLKYLQICGNGDPSKVSHLRLAQAWEDHQGWVCSVSDMLLLGMLFRFIACCCLLVHVGAVRSGWANFLGKAGSTWKLVGWVSALLVGSFMGMFLVAEIYVMGQTDMTVHWQDVFGWW